MSAGTARYPAPAVQYPVGRSRWLIVVLVLMQLASLAVLVAWLLQGAGAEQHVAMASLLLWAGAALLVLRFWSRLPVGTLRWEGACWHLCRVAGPPVDQTLGEVAVVQLDLQHHMALAFPDARPAIWLLVERRREPVCWLELRRAVYSRPSAVTPKIRHSPPEGHSS